MRLFALAAGFVLGVAPLALAQPLPDSTVALGTVEVSAAPFTLDAAGAPFAVSVVERPADERRGSAPLTLDEVTRAVPGLHVADRASPSQGERITLRGVGWRAGFGVRGVQVLLDGLPLTMADGQAVLNMIDPAFVRRIEVVRGPASVFWGNASGGVLALSTLPEGTAREALVRQSVGAFGLSRTDVQAALALPTATVGAYASYLDQDGYRAHSRWRAARVGLSGRFRLGEGRTLQAVGVFAHVPIAEAPGALTRALYDADPSQADPRSLQTNARKEVEQGHLGVTYSDRIGGATVRATAYGALRTLDNALSFGFITLDRRAGGLRLTAEGTRGTLTWGVGLEADAQRDDRRETDNVDGEPGPNVQVEQTERADNQAAFARVALPLGPVLATGGVRYDRLRYSADDLLGSGDGGRTFHAVSLSAGAALPYHGGRLYADVSTGLDTPTTQELGNRPDGQGGFNLDLQPESTLGLEGGAAGVLSIPRLSYDLALFALRIDGLLTPFELAEDGPTYYRNEGTTRHLGAEAALTWSLPSDLSLTGAYTLLDATFTAGASDGRRVPGLPVHRATAALDWRPGPAVVTLDVEAATASYVDSANTARNEGYAVVGARVSATGIPLAGGARLVPFLAVRNLFDARYSASVVVNAAGGRYFEPAAGRAWRAGLAVTLE